MNKNPTKKLDQNNKKTSKTPKILCFESFENFDENA